MAAKAGRAGKKSVALWLTTDTNDRLNKLTMMANLQTPSGTHTLTKSEIVTHLINQAYEQADIKEPDQPDASQSQLQQLINKHFPPGYEQAAQADEVSTATQPTPYNPIEDPVVNPVISSNRGGGTQKQQNTEETNADADADALTLLGQLGPPSAEQLTYQSDPTNLPDGDEQDFKLP
jgi:hypothetical protein